MGLKFVPLSFFEEVAKKSLADYYFSTLRTYTERHRDFTEIHRVKK